jgi:hypothetical protein
MAKKERNNKMDIAIGEQIPLIDVGPENLKKIAPVAREYKKVLRNRIKLLSAEVKLKQKLHGLIKQSKLKPVDGKIKFFCEGLDIEVEYRDEVIHIREHKEPKKRGRKPKDTASTEELK